MIRFDKLWKYIFYYWFIYNICKSLYIRLSHEDYKSNVFRHMIDKKKHYFKDGNAIFKVKKKYRRKLRKMIASSHRYNTQHMLYLSAIINRSKYRLIRKYRKKYRILRTRKNIYDRKLIKVKYQSNLEIPVYKYFVKQRYVIFFPIENLYHVAKILFF
jgi:hypothetical protein